MDKLRCLVVDDEDVAIDGIIDYMSEVDYLELAGRCSSAVEAKKAFREQDIDLMFLDINMPRITGLEMLESLQKPPLVILTTAYSEYALDGFRLNVVDYLLKPYTFARFVQAADRAMEWYRLRLSAGNPATWKDMYIRQGDSFVRINPDEILLAEAMQNYLKIYLEDNKTYIIHQTMSSLEGMLPKDRFYRVHNSFIVNVGCIESISGGKLSVGGKEIPLSKHRKGEFLQSVVYKKLMSK